MPGVDFEDALRKFSGRVCCFCCEALYGEEDLRKGLAYIVVQALWETFDRCVEGEDSTVPFFVCRDQDGCARNRAERGVRANEAQWKMFQAEGRSAFKHKCMTWIQVCHDEAKATVRDHISITPEAARLRWAMSHCRALVETPEDASALLEAAHMVCAQAVQPFAPPQGWHGPGISLSLRGLDPGTRMTMAATRTRPNQRSVARPVLRVQRNRRQVDSTRTTWNSC